MAFAVGEQRVASLKNCTFQAQSCQHILHRPAGLDVHMNIAGRHQRQAAGLTQGLQAD